MPMSSETLSFGEWLEDQLEANRLTQNAFAAMIESNSGSVSRWVNNHRTPDPATCYRIAEALGEDPLEVLVRAGHVDEDDSEVRRMRAAKEAEEAYQQAARAVARISALETEPFDPWLKSIGEMSPEDFERLKVAVREREEYERRHGRGNGRQ